MLAKLVYPYIGIVLGLFGDRVHTADFKVGYLTADRTTKFVHKKQGRIISGAMTLAVETINARSDLLAGHRLHFVWGDTMADTLIGTAVLTQQWREGAIAFFGPEDSCDVEARVAAAWDLPMISYKCADHRLSDKSLYPTFARTFPPASQVTRSVLALLSHFGWRRFTIVAGSSSKWQSIADRLQQLATAANISLNDRLRFSEPYVPETGVNPFPAIVENSYLDTRVYMFLGEHDGMVEFMRSLETRGLLQTGEYVVIHVDLDTYTKHDPLKYFKRTYDPATDSGHYTPSSSLIVIVSSPPTNPDYKAFHLAVNDYNERPPFEFPNPFGQPKEISVYAAYLYDAVFLYARALDDVIALHGVDAATNGSVVFDKIKNRSYKSIQGFHSYIDENGDAEGNYTVLTRTASASKYGIYSMLPVGHFQIRNGFPVFSQLENTSFNWTRNGPPLDEPECGYRRQKCLVPPNYTIEIVCGILGGILLITAIVLLLVYRNWRYEQEIAGLSWKINFANLQSMSAQKSCLYDSKMTVGSQASGDSRMSWVQVFTTAATYKGTMVALKRYIARNVDITRAMKKEMKTMRDLRHDNVNAFIGACVGPQDFIAVTEYCSKGSLQDILENDDLNLDTMFMSSLVMDLVKGMLFLHESDLHVHGNLKSSNCVVNSRWSLQITDFGLFELRRRPAADQSDYAKYRDLLWTAPELLRSTHPHRRGTQKSDVYAFGIILYEVVGRAGPYGNVEMSPQEIIAAVSQRRPCPYRPDVDKVDCQDYLKSCMQDCWSEVVDVRPDFRTIRTRLKPMRKGMKSNIFDNMLSMMELYQRHLEDLVSERTVQLEDEKKKTEGLLLRMLPASVAQPLLRGKPVVPETFESVTIYFSDICGFTAMSADSSPMQVVDLLNDLYTLFDSIIGAYDVYKVETIGDAYMVVSGLPVRNGNNHAGHVASMSLHLLAAMRTFRIRHRPGEVLKLRIGIHTGPCVAGVVGLTMPRYCLFGDTVNTSSRMEANGEALKIHVSEQTKSVLEILGGYVLEPRGYVNMKGKGSVFTYWLVGENRPKVAALDVHTDVTSPSSNTNVQNETPNLKNDTRTTGSFLDLMRNGRSNSNVSHGGRGGSLHRSLSAAMGSSPGQGHRETDNLIPPETSHECRKTTRRNSAGSATWIKMLETTLPVPTISVHDTDGELCKLNHDCRSCEQTCNFDSDSGANSQCTKHCLDSKRGMEILA